MKGSICLGCLVLLLLVTGAGIPAAASPAISSISPSSGPNNGYVTVTITGTGFNSQSTAWMTPASVCDPSNQIYSSGCSWSPASGTCSFLFQGQTTGAYTVWVESPLIVGFNG